MNISDYFHIFLVEPEDSINVGCVARAMMNCGFRYLHLVSPINYDEEKALWSACWAKDILHNVSIHSELSSALSEMTEIVGFTARQSKDRRNHLYLHHWVENLKTIPENSKIALLFGNERTGLHNDAIKHCSTLVCIPSAPENPSYNLAQAVLLSLYEIYRQTFNDGDHITVAGQAPANESEVNYLNQLILNILHKTDFKSPPAVERIFDNLIRRMKPDKRELGILLAVFDHIARVTDSK